MKSGAELLPSELSMLFEYNFRHSSAVQNATAAHEAAVCPIAERHSQLWRTLLRQLFWKLPRIPVADGYR